MRGRGKINNRGRPRPRLVAARPLTDQAGIDDAQTWMRWIPRSHSDLAMAPQCRPGAIPSIAPGQIAGLLTRTSARWRQPRTAPSELRRAMRDPSKFGPCSTLRGRRRCSSLLGDRRTPDGTGTAIGSQISSATSITRSELSWFGSSDADLSRTHAHRVIEAAVSVVVTEVKGTADDLSTPGRVAVSIAVPLDQDGGAVIRQCPARSSVPPNPSTSRTR
jgi:hypothetical protein